MGDWWMSNQTMERALSFAGYDVRHVWGTGTHNGAQAAAIFPDAMQWLWRDWVVACSRRHFGQSRTRGDPRGGADVACRRRALLGRTPRFGLQMDVSSIPVLTANHWS